MRAQDALDRAEGALTYIRAAELQERPVRVTGDLDEFRAIHRQLFQDVYLWAGEVRTVDLRKSVAGAEHFLSVGAIVGYGVGTRLDRPLGARRRSRGAGLPGGQRRGCGLGDLRPGGGR